MAMQGLPRRNVQPIHSVKNGTLQNACSTSPRVVADLGKSALLHIARLMNSLAKGFKNGDKSAVAMLKKLELYDRTGKPVVCRDPHHEHHGPVVCNSPNTRQLGCVSQDMEPPKLSSILRKSSDMQKPIQCVKFTKAVARHADIRDQNPSLGMICPGDPHQRSPNAPKFEDRSKVPARQRGSLNEKKVTFFSLSKNRCLPASTLKPEEREFVVDFGASMHMISKKGLK